MNTKTKNYDKNSSNLQISLSYSFFRIFFILILLISIVACGVKRQYSDIDGDNNIDPLTDSFEDVINSGTIPGGVSLAENSLIADTLGYVRANAGATIKTFYITEKGSGDYSGNNWTNTQPGTNLRKVIDSISDASSDKVYIVLLGSGTYKTTTDNDRDVSFNMKNHTAIVGGFYVNDREEGSWLRSNATVFSGDIGVVGDNTDNTKRIFYHGVGTINNSAVLYGVAIEDGYNSDGSGAGMHNSYASPTLIGVTFLRNYAKFGGGMYNSFSSPTLVNSSFISNESIFFGNGGGMFNIESSPFLVNTTFYYNVADGGVGGAIYNQDSSTTLVGATIVSNSSVGGAGGIFSAYLNQTELTISGVRLINSVVWGNAVPNNPTQIFLANADSDEQRIVIAGSVLQGGSNDIISTNADGLSQNFPNYYDVVELNPVLSRFVAGKSPSGGYVPISTGSSAVNAGLHVKISGTFANDGTGLGAIIYYSENGNDWYSSITSSGLTGSMTPPSTAVYLTKYDVTGRERTGQPDAGSYEAR